MSEWRQCMQRSCNGSIYNFKEFTSADYEFLLDLLRDGAKVAIPPTFTKDDCTRVIALAVKFDWHALSVLKRELDAAFDARV